eukprot:CAMPEP_0197390744 /NCGR_PEP_ID=MMETSP1165-20131217/2610_1 /TAXON_ID=284809 /ORGANISM="Chrysocystis fragilis, Strain CCMP3189" /LENGTH=217 /DNA_ID=CAMNT_0042916251 /DNA_START=78 /DNA_END=731 /DNA_ORIENTATION=+
MKRVRFEEEDEELTEEEVKRHREELEREEAEKEAALEAALLTAASALKGDGEDAGELAALVLKTGEALPSPTSTTQFPAEVSKDASLETAMAAHSAKLRYEQQVRDEEEREAMAEDMRQIAELEREAEAIEREAKAFEAARMERLEREALVLEQAAVAAESTRQAQLAKEREDAFSVDFAVGPRWTINTSLPKRQLSLPRRPLFSQPPPAFVPTFRR